MLLDLRFSQKGYLVTKPPAPPRELKSRGRKLWRDLQEAAEFSDAETQILRESCRCVDMIDTLSASIEEAGTMVTGSQGQQVLNPAIAELRQQQAALARLIGALHLPEEEDQENKFRTKRAKAGAAGRWGPPGLRAVK